jgi:hypothetical protein
MIKMKRTWISQERITEIFLCLILLASYSYVFPRWADPNQNSRLDMVVAVVDGHTFQIDTYVDNTVDYAKVGAHYYSDKAPGTAFLGIPLYAGLRVILNLPVMDRIVEQLGNNQAFKATLRENGSGILKDKVAFAIAQVVLTFFLSALPSAFLGVLLFRIVRRFTHKISISLAVVLGYGLLTPAFTYSGAFYGHQTVAALLFAAFYVLFTYQNHLTAWKLLLVGLLLGLSVFTEYPAFLIVVILVVYAFYLLYRYQTWRLIAWPILGGAVFAIALALYNQAIFGGFFKLGYSDSTLWSTQHDTGFMSLTYPHWKAIWGLTFGVFRGMFLLSPLLLLALPGFVFWWRSKQYRAEFWVALGSSLAYFLFNASSVMWWGGFSVGPRYLVPMLPFMALSLSWVFIQWRERTWFKPLTVFLYAWSFVATWGMTLAEQAYPPDTLPNPYLQFMLPNWLKGNIARNFGTILGLPGIWSLTPLFLILALLSLAGWLATRPHSAAESDEPLRVGETLS